MSTPPNKLALITKPAQSGKDRRVSDIIREDQLRCSLFGDDEYVTIIFHGLTKSLGCQKSARMATEKETYDTKKILLWNSSGAQDSYTESGVKHSKCSAKELFSDILTDDIRYILCCDNAKRWKALEDLCKKTDQYMESNPSGRRIQFRIIVDEADAQKSWHKFASDIVPLSPSVGEMCLVTATPESIIRCYKSIRIYPDLTPIPECYVGCEDQRFVIHDLVHSSAMDYITAVFDQEDVKQLFTPGSRWFIPADVARKTHEDVAAFFRERGANVALINGLEKKILFHDGREYDISGDIASGTFEMGQIIKSYWKDDDRLRAAPFIVTGNLCVERGISFQDSREGIFLFDGAIIANIIDSAKAYQVLARMFGNIKHVRGDHRGTIFTTSLVKKKAEDMEKLVIGINAAALNRHDTTITYTDVKHIKKGKCPTTALERRSFVCDTFEEAQQIARDVWGQTLNMTNRTVIDGIPLAPFGLREQFFDPTTNEFKNPTQEYLHARMWGVEQECESCRASPIQDPVRPFKWCVYGWKKPETAVAGAGASLDELLG
jgi:hypothetical protein